jgi:hypothetical protein
MGLTLHREMTVLIRIISKDSHEVKNHKYINIRHNNSILNIKLL